MHAATPAVQFGPLALKAVRESWVAAGLARSEVNRRTNMARRVFKWAAGEELVPAEVYHRLATVGGLQKGRSAARETEPVGPVDAAHVDATLPFLNGEVPGLVGFMRLTGCRPGEACLLRWCDVDRSGPVWLYRPAHHKNAHRGKPRVIAIGPRAQQLLLGLPRVGPTEFLFDPRRAVAELHARRSAGRETPRYPSHLKRTAAKRVGVPRTPPRPRYSPESVRQAVVRAVERANRAGAERAEATGTEFVPIPEWHPNQLRHAHGTEVRRRYGLEAAQAVLGHERADVTQVYAEKNLALAARVSVEIG